MSKTQHNESRADFLRIYGPAVLLAVVAFLVAYQFVAPAPPNRIVMATGEPGGAYYAFGEKYREILARDKVEVEVRATAGSAENITLLELDESEVQVAEDITLLAPTSNLVAGPDLHPALVDLLLQAADQVHEDGSLSTGGACVNGSTGGTRNCESWRRAWARRSHRNK